MPNGAALLCKNAAARVSKLQNGLIYSYAFWMVLGLVAIIFVFLSSFKNFGIF
jgi:hypothetical protein